MKNLIKKEVNNVPTMISLADQNIMYKVFHPEFQPNRQYKALAYAIFAETAWAQLVFINEKGMTYSVVVYKTRAINIEDWSMENNAIKDLESPKVVGKNPDINEVDTGMIKH